MPTVDEAFVQSPEFADAIKSIIASNDPTVITVKFIRKELQKKFSLDADAFNPVKAQFRALVDQIFLSMSNDQDEEAETDEPVKPKKKATPKAKAAPKTKKTKFKQPESDEEEEDDASDAAADDSEFEEEVKRPKKAARKKTTARATKKSATKATVQSDTEEDEDQDVKKEFKDEDSPMTEASADDDKKNVKIENKALKRGFGSDEDEDEESQSAAGRDADSSDDSILLDEEPVKKKTKKQPAKRAKTSASTSSDTTSATDETIKRLKSYVFKCGVRKMWNKELADCTTKKQQVDKLKQMLEDLGVHGRPTLEKCQAVKEERELRQEVEGLNPSNIIETPGRRSTRSATSNAPRRRIIMDSDSDEDDDDDEEEKEDEDEDHEDHDEDQNKDANKEEKKKTPSNTLDISFLGDQSDDDSE